MRSGIPFLSLSTLLQYTVSLNKMPQPASFYVGIQQSQPHENIGYNTQPAFVVSGSKAIESTRAKVTVLEAFLNKI
jgi:hypothetical protein